MPIITAGDYDDCVTAAQRYITLHPGSADAAYAQYLIGASNFEEIPDITRDQARTEKALGALEEVIRKYPTSEYAVSAKQKIEVARDQLAGKEMEIGRYYLDKKDYTGAINRFKVVVTKYQTTRHVEEALMRLTEAYMALGIVDEAQTAAAVLGHNFPDSIWYKHAYTLVKTGGVEPGRTAAPGSARRSEFQESRVWASVALASRHGPRLCRASMRATAICESAMAGLTGSSAFADDDRLRLGPMLSRLSIRDIVLIDRLDIDFAAGLAVLTGETGAGKSILLDAFALALGARGDQALVRHGAEQGQVTAVFEVARAHPARALLKANDIPAEDELILRRVQFADGRTRAFVNDQPVSVQVMKELGSRAGRDPRPARRTRAGRCRHPSPPARCFRRAGRRRRQGRGAVGGAARGAGAADAHRAEVERAKREGDWLRHAVEELGKLGPQTARKPRSPSGAPP